MKCPDCGSQNAPGAKECHSCGKPLRAGALTKASEELGSRAGRLLDRMPSQDRVEPREVAHKMRMDYLAMNREPIPRTIEAMCTLMGNFHKMQINTRSMIAEAAAVIQKQFSIREVAIGLKSASDGMYRYEYLLGIRPEAEAATRRIQYTESEFWDDKRYKCTKISRLTRLFLAEDNPYTNEEKDSYSRPFMLDFKRSSIDMAVEGDYIDVVIPGAEGETLGWIEISGTRSGKLPDAMAIRWVEAVATLIGAAMVCNDIRRVMARESSRKPQS